MELPSLSGSPFPGVTLVPGLLRGGCAWWQGTLATESSFSSPDPDINWLINSSKLFDTSLLDGLGMRNKKDFTLQDYWADQMYLIDTVFIAVPGT